MTGPADLQPEGPVIALPVYAGVSELELGLMVAVCRLCGGAGAARTVNRSRASIVTAGGLVSTPHVLYAALPKPAGLLLPGGPGAQKAARDPLLREFLARPMGACPLAPAVAACCFSGTRVCCATRWWVAPPTSRTRSGATALPTCAPAKSSPAAL
ncbi:MAG: transcriptional regulator [Deinococcota bacterium]